MTRYQFLIDTYETERLKVLSAWAMFGARDLEVRPHSDRGRNALEHMAHQCTSEYNWFRDMFQIDTPAPPDTGSRAAFVEAAKKERYFWPAK